MTSQYLARIDDGSSRQYTYSTSTNTWTMYDKTSTRYLFGASDNSRFAIYFRTAPSLVNGTAGRP